MRGREQTKSAKQTAPNSASAAAPGASPVQAGELEEAISVTPSRTSGNGNGSSNSSSLLIPTKGERKILGVSHQRPLSLVFVIDVTGSMRGSIDAVKDNVAAFADAVTQRAFELGLAAIAFDDGIRSKFDLSRDVNAFKKHIESQGADGGDDTPEGSLLAMDEAMTMLETQETRPDAVRGLVLITDVVGHDGNSRRNCDESALINRINRLDTAKRDRFKFFFSFGMDVDVRISGACGRRAFLQYENILESILPELALEKRGGTVDFPFSGNAFLTQLPALLEQTVPAVSMACGPLKADLIVNGITVQSWAAADASEAIRIGREQSEFPAFANLNDADLTAWELSSAHADVTYACVDNAAEASATPSLATENVPIGSLVRR